MYESAVYDPMMTVEQDTSRFAPEVEIPPGVRVMVRRWGKWWECKWKSCTLCMPDNKGPVLQKEPIYVEGRDLTADAFAARLRNLGYKFVGVGDPVEDDQ